MSCNAEHYKAAWDWIGRELNWTIEQLVQVSGGRWLAYAIIALAIVPLAWIFLYVSRVIIPGFVKWYYGETITEKALDWWRRKGLAFLGFKRSTAVVSVAAGVVFYLLIRIAAAFPSYYWIGIPMLVATFVGIAFVGYAVSGNVPENDVDRNNYFKRFHSPTVTGLGLGVATIVLDFVIHSTTVLIHYLQSA